MSEVQGDPGWGYRHRGRDASTIGVAIDTSFDGTVNIASIFQHGFCGVSIIKKCFGVIGKIPTFTKYFAG